MRRGVSRQAVVVEIYEGVVTGGGGYTDHPTSVQIPLEEGKLGHFLARIPSSPRIRKGYRVRITVQAITQGEPPETLPEDQPEEASE
jgi:hypothetical protein